MLILKIVADHVVFPVKDFKLLIENRDVLLDLDQKRIPVFKDVFGKEIINWPQNTIYRGLRLALCEIDNIVEKGLIVNNSYFSRLPIIAGLNSLLSSKNNERSQDFCSVVFEVDTRYLPITYTSSRDPQDPNLIVNTNIPATALSRVFVYSLYLQRFIAY